MEDGDFVGLKALEAVYELLDVLEDLNKPDISSSKRYVITKRLSAIKSSLPHMPPGLRAWLRSKRRFRLNVLDEETVE
jgi:hypothetical protein